YSMLMYPWKRTSRRARRTAGTSSAPRPKTTSWRVWLSWSLRCRPKLRAPIARTCWAGAGRRLNGACAPRIRGAVSRQVPRRAGGGGVPAVQVAALRPVRVDGDGDVELAHQPVEAVEAVRAGVGAEVAHAQGAGELEGAAVGVVVAREALDAEGDGRDVVLEA